MLISERKKLLKTRAHHLQPVVMVGDKGLTAPVHEEIEAALLAHELIKIRVNAVDRKARQVLVDAICSQHKAELVMKIGHVIAIYKAKPSA